MASDVNVAAKPFSKNEMAARLAQDIPDGWYVNLGIGVPTLAADFIPADREVIIHSENGILGMGPTPAPDKIDPWLVNASKKPVTLITGAALFHHADSFTIIRGRHLDLCVLGAYEVAANGDIANWTTGSDDRLPAIGGAMDLALGAKRLWVVMEHVTKKGEPKLLEKCSYPLTAQRAVTRVYTNYAVLDISKRGFELVDMVPGLTFDELQAMTAAKIHRPA